MLRPSLRNPNQMRPVSIETAVNKWAEGSCIIKIGGTHVICTASVDFAQPTWKRMQGKTGGWVTAEYSMLPRANETRKSHDAMCRDQRATEISRLIGRALRSVVDLEVLGKNTITIDCDVIQADGGTRCAAITGGFVAMALAVRWMMQNNYLAENPIGEHVAAVSAGLWKNELVLDLDYAEDSDAELDANFVVAESGRFVEVQSTGEQHPFDRAQLNELMDMAATGAQKLIALQHRALEE
ncbi:MAG: ribonuclease PH [Alphaproteobacteria bacterium]|nr:ribonuclease PH [Alphaproteobacteria bacterium]